MNVLQVISRAIAIDKKIKSIESENGYEPFTTFAYDMAVATFFKYGVKDTYDKVVKEWLCDYKYFTEFVLVLNHLCWFYYYNNEPELSKQFSELYYDAKDKFYEHFADNKEANNYFFNVTY